MFKSLACACSPGPPSDTMIVRYLDDLFEAFVRLYASVYHQLLDNIDIDANVTMTKYLLAPLGHHELLPPSLTSCTPSCPGTDSCPSSYLVTVIFWAVIQLTRCFSRAIVGTIECNAFHQKWNGQNTFKETDFPSSVGGGSSETTTYLVHLK